MRKLLMVILLGLLSACHSDSTDAVAENASEKGGTKTDVTITPNSARPVHWSYSGARGPAQWGQLDPAYLRCAEGKQQSPVDIISSVVDKGIDWQFNYQTSSLRIAHNEHMENIIDNGHTIQVTVDEGSTFMLQGRIYHLKQFHFHTPSEHEIDGKYFPMEMHFVHQSDSGQLAVVGILLEEGKENDNLAKIVAHLPGAKGEMNHHSDVHLALQFHLPKINEGYHYTGSLTTPPCSEPVEWLVFRNPVSAGKEQIAAIASRIGPNNRPIQALNDRTIKFDVLFGNIQD
jgi:carbonic anhydrase